MKLQSRDVLLALSLLFAHAMGILIETETGQCGLDELNHSVLVKCDDCKRSEQRSYDSIWPRNKREVTHVQSTRGGRRFSVSNLTNLDYKVNEHMKLFDINTTLSVQTRHNPHKSRIYGLGATLNMGHLVSAMEKGRFEALYGLIIDNLFAQSGANMGLLRLKLETDSIIGQNITHLLHQFDREVARSRGALGESQQLLKIVIHPIYESTRDHIVELAKKLSSASNVFTAASIWAFVLEDGATKEPDVSFLNLVREALPPGCNIFAPVNIEDAPNLLKEASTRIDGLLIQSEESVPYDVLEHLARDSKESFALLTVARRRARTKLYGDWSNAHEYAVEILNHLNLGANAFFEDLTIASIDSELPSTDCSIYSLVESKRIHFNGPMFYAVGHFSRYLTDSQPLKFQVFTQPNMFASHYSAFESNQGAYIISMIVNGNEHKQPFSWVVDDKVVANTLLETKSFNTFITKV